MLKEVLLLALVVWLAMPAAHTWKPPDNGSQNDGDTSKVISRPSSQDTEQYLRDIRNYIHHGYLDPTRHEISRQLRGHGIEKKARNKVEIKIGNKVEKKAQNKNSKNGDNSDSGSDASQDFRSQDIQQKRRTQRVYIPHGHGYWNSTGHKKFAWEICEEIVEANKFGRAGKKEPKSTKGNSLTDIKSFDAFKLKFNKRYVNDKQEADRKYIFQKNVQCIEDHNRLYKLGEKTYMKQLSSWSDMTYDEFRQDHVGCIKVHDFSVEGYGKYGKIYKPEKGGKEPESIDYRQCGAMNPIRDQKECGSCWAFSVVSSIESQIFLKYRKKIELSEQEMVDCSPNTSGCKGGWPSETLKDYMGKEIALRKSYPYIAQDGQCYKDAPKTEYKVSSMLYIKPENEAHLLNALVHKGPVSVVIHTSWNFAHYKEGVLDDEECTKDRHVDHVVTLIGYGATEDGKKYWLLRNSHGKGVGEGGYFKLARDKKNHCRISDFAYIPVIH